MGKGKGPRKTPEKADLVPSPSPLPRPVVSEYSPPALVELTRAIRLAVGALLDLADAAAEAISKRIEGRAD